MTDWVLSIDFGTSFTSAAIREDRRAGLVRMQSPQGPRDVMPSGVFLREGGELIVGWVAENQAVLAPDRFEPTPKRQLGVDEYLLLGGESVPVVDVVAAVLGRVVAEARRSRGETDPSLVCLTRPASWARGRVDALVEAARGAGIENPRLLTEPEGAALHFATERVGIGGLVAVYDLGGGTFDAAVLERAGEASFRVRGRPGGRDGLGGEEFDRKLYEHVAKQLAFEAPEQWGRIRANARAHRDFRGEVVRAKEALSYSSAHDLYLPEGEERPSWRVTREEFEELVRPDIDVSVEILARTLEHAGIDDPADPSKLAELYLAGGSSRIPLVAQAIGERLGRVPRSLDEPKSVVALGASNVERTGEPAPPPSAKPPAAEEPPPAPPTGESPPPPPPPPPPDDEPPPEEPPPSDGKAPPPPPERSRARTIGIALAVLVALVLLVVAIATSLDDSGSDDDFDGFSGSFGAETTPGPLPGGTAADFVAVTDAEERLYRAVPETDCRRDEGPAEAAATLTCFPDDGLVVAYELFPDVDSLRVVYDSLARDPETEIAGAGGCPDDPAARAQWARDGVQRGRWVCYLTARGEDAHVVWTDEERAVLAVVSHDEVLERDFGPLLAYWQIGTRVGLERTSRSSRGPERLTLVRIPG